MAQLRALDLSKGLASPQCEIAPNKDSKFRIANITDRFGYQLVLI